jgi:hypothetical protein
MAATAAVSIRNSGGWTNNSIRVCSVKPLSIQAPEWQLNAPGRISAPASDRASFAGPVAQWLEPTAHNGLVGGSSPPGPTNPRSFLAMFAGRAPRRARLIQVGDNSKQVFWCWVRCSRQPDTIPFPPRERLALPGRNPHPAADFSQISSLRSLARNEARPI